METKTKNALDAITGGMAVNAASDKFKVHKSALYYHMRKKPKKAAPRSKVVAIPEGNFDRVVMFFGSPDAVAQAARSML